MVMWYTAMKYVWGTQLKENIKKITGRYVNEGCGIPEERAKLSERAKKWFVQWCIWKQWLICGKIPLNALCISNTQLMHQYILTNKPNVSVMQVNYLFACIKVCPGV